MQFAFPLKLHFHLIAFAPRISMRDAKDTEILYVEQKVFALREAVKVFNNSEDKKLLYTMQADQIIDFGARYMFKTADGKEIGSVRQEGMRSIVRASYEIQDKQGKVVYRVIQNNPWVAFMDSLLSIIPFADLLSGFLFHPLYGLVEKEGDDPILTMKKKPSFFESEFDIALQKEKLPKENEELIVLALLMIVQLERQRG